MLENDEWSLGGVRFLGCTLWSDFMAAGAGELEAHNSGVGRLLNNYEVIAVGATSRNAAAGKRGALHLESRALAGRAPRRAPHDGPTVVVTHHAPLIRGAARRRPLARALVGAFASDLQRADGRATASRCGSTATRTGPPTSTSHGTRVVSNPRGYPHEPVAGFDAARVVEIA